MINVVPNEVTIHLLYLSPRGRVLEWVVVMPVTRGPEFRIITRALNLEDTVYFADVVPFFERTRHVCMLMKVV